MHKKSFYYFTIISITLIGIFLSDTPAYSGVIFKGDFETGNFSQWRDKGEFCCSYSGQVVTSPVRAGKYAARYELRDTDPKIFNGRRSELGIYKDSRIGKIGGPDEWYGFSIYLPADYKVDRYYDLVAQWHAHKDPGEAGRSPVLWLVTENGNWEFRTQYSSKRIQTGDDGTRVVLLNKSYQKDVWTDWVVHVKWSYQSDGFVEVWKDGVKVVDYKGPNCYNDQNNIYFKWGIYKAWWNHRTTDVSKRVIYNDELRIGDSNSSYVEVAPDTPDVISPSKPFLNIAVSK